MERVSCAFGCLNETGCIRWTARLIYLRRLKAASSWPVAFFAESLLVSQSLQIGGGGGKREEERGRRMVLKPAQVELEVQGDR